MFCVVSKRAQNPKCVSPNAWYADRVLGQSVLTIALAATVSLGGFAAAAPDAVPAPTPVACSDEFARYGIDLDGFATRMDALGVFASNLPKAGVPGSEAHARFEAERVRLQKDIPGIHVLLGDHRRGDATLSVANAVRAHNLKNQLQLVDTLLTAFSLTLAADDDLDRFLQSRGPMLGSLARTAGFLARTARRAPDSVELMPFPVVFLNEDLNTLSKALFPPDTLLTLSSARGDAWVGVEVDGDEPLLVETFTNLMVNAASAMKTHGGRRFAVRVSSRAMLKDAPPPLGVFRPVAPSRDGNHVVFSFVDSGGGMAADRIALLWNGQSTKGHEGNGLGLPHVARVVRAHGGFIDVVCRVGTGTSISIGLPIRPPTAPVHATVVEPVRAELPQVIVVDDNTDSADSLATIFDLLGFTAAPAYRGADALLAVGPGKPQLVVLDYTIPGETAEATIQALRAKSPDVIVVMLCGYAPGDRFADLAKLVDGWWVKPVEPSTALEFAIAKLRR